MKKFLMMLFVIATISIIAMLGATSASAATSGTTGDCTWTLDGTVLTISGNGEMADYSYSGSSKSPWGTAITEVIIGDGVTTIGEYAFYVCSKLTSATIPESVTSIGKGAFIHCSSLTSITIPDGVTTIGEYAFPNCSSLTNVTIGNSVTSIGKDAFYDCSSLTSITIPDSVTSIGEDAFNACNRLKSVYIKSPIVAKYFGSHSSHLFSFANTIYVDEKLTEVGEYVSETFPCNFSGVEYEGTTYNRYSFIHDYDNSCDAACDCGFIREITHSYETTWQKDDTNHWHACSVCGAPDEKINHQFGNAMDENCDICGYTRQTQAAPHDTTNNMDTTTIIITIVAVGALGVGSGLIIGKMKKK